MKMTQEHYDYMKQAIGNINIDAVKRSIMESGRVPKDYDKRLRFDCMYAAGLTKWVCDNLYSYMDDSHINTALKSIMKELAI